MQRAAVVNDIICDLVCEDIIRSGRVRRQSAGLTQMVLFRKNPASPPLVTCPASRQRLPEAEAGSAVPSYCR